MFSFATILNDVLTPVAGGAQRLLALAATTEEKVHDWEHDNPFVAEAVNLALSEANVVLPVPAVTAVAQAALGVAKAIAALAPAPTAPATK